MATHRSYRYFKALRPIRVILDLVHTDLNIQLLMELELLLHVVWGSEKTYDNFGTSDI